MFYDNNISEYADINYKINKLYLVEGRLRFWGWIIAFGWKEKIPSLIWKK